MRRVGIILLVLMAFVSVACPTAVPTPTPTVEPTATATPEPDVMPPEATILPGTPSPAGLQLATPGTRVETSTPYRIQIADIGVDALVIGVGLEANGAMAAPQNPFVVGWYYPGREPGSGGNALLSGHVDYWDATAKVGRPGAFWNLRNIKLGAKVYVTEGGKRYSYTVTEAKWFAFNDRAALAYLNPNLGARLTLITCGGDFDVKTWNYQKRLLVIGSMDAAAG